MMRKCHLNTCPVGIATQDPVLRAKFTGQPEDVINFFFFIAEQLRAIMAKLGFRKVDDMVGRVEMLETRHAIEHWKARGLDLSEILYNPPAPSRVARHCTTKQDHGLDEALDYKLIDHAREAIENQTPIDFKLPIRNVHRTVGAMLSGEIARSTVRRGCRTTPSSSSSTVRPARALALSSREAFRSSSKAMPTITWVKGSRADKLVVYPPRNSTFVPEENILIGNVVLYGATSGEAFFNGMAGERFAVRNSGASAVVEGLGDHGCEYMTNGLVIVLGKVGRNFAAGMSGGIAYVLDEIGQFAGFRCNKASVDLEQVFDPADQQFLRDWIIRHLEDTGSPRAKWVLENWAAMLPKFVKVFPHEFKRVMKKRAQRETTRIVFRGGTGMPG